MDVGCKLLATPLCTKTRRSALANIGAMMPTAWKFILVAMAGWIHRNQEDVIEYLREENRVLREQLGPARLRFTDAQRPKPWPSAGVGFVTSPSLSRR